MGLLYGRTWLTVAERAGKTSHFQAQKGPLTEKGASTDNYGEY